MANLLATNPCEMNCLFLPLRQSHVRLAVQREDAMTSLLAVNLCEKQPDLQKTHKRSRLWISLLSPSRQLNIKPPRGATAWVGAFVLPDCAPQCSDVQCALLCLPFKNFSSPGRTAPLTLWQSMSTISPMA